MLTRIGLTRFHATDPERRNKRELVYLSILLKEKEEQPDNTRYGALLPLIVIAKHTPVTICSLT